MISLLVTLLVLVIVVAIVFYALSLLPIPAPWINIIKAIVALIVLLIVLSHLMGWGGGVAHPLLH